MVLEVVTPFLASIKNLVTERLKKILFLSSYPTNQTLKDGMVQRIKNIDEIFLNHPRLYVDVKFWSNFKRSVSEPEQNVTEYKLNAFMHFFFIGKLFRSSEIVYLHSIYGLIKVIVQLSISKKVICLDMHGVVPEENLIENGKWHFYYYKLIERVAILLATRIIYVSKAMQQYFVEKYTNISKVDLVYPVFANITPDRIPLNLHSNIVEGDTVFVYSGNLQSWQNIPEILDLIQRYQQVANYRFIILTGYPNAFKKKLLQRRINLERVEVICVNSDEIDQYYRKAHYGFILRSDHLVNHVANPTKMIEYLLFGLVPIVKSSNIGDFDTYPYEYVTASDFNDKLKPRKSQVNQDIAFKILTEKENLSAFVIAD